MRIKKLVINVLDYCLYFVSVIFGEKIFLKLRYFLFLHEWPNIDKPRSFQEKLQWLKLNDRKEIYHDMVDKVEAKYFIERIVGKEYVIPTLGVYDALDDVDYNVLPNKFIIKGTTDSGAYFICKDKSKLDIDLIKSKLQRNTKLDYYKMYGEWPYKGLIHRYIIEPLLEDEELGYLCDYKFYCFNGEPKIFYVTTDKGQNKLTKQDFFDINGNHIDIEDVKYPNNRVLRPNIPVNLDKMIEISKKLSHGTYHLRVDFYEVKGKVYVGELTFYEAAGFCLFSPKKYNDILGSWIKLPID